MPRAFANISHRSVYIVMVVKVRLVPKVDQGSDVNY